MTDARPVTWGRRVRWPEGQPIAMTIGVALEAFERHSQYRTETSSAARDGFSLSYAEYGIRVGVWRLLDLFEAEGVLASFSVSGLLAERNPEVVKAVVDAGHDVIGHGWANDLLMADADTDGERDMVARTLAAIESASGKRPTGWASPGNVGSDHTRDILLDAGVTWSGDDASDDLPFVDAVGERSMVVLPKVNVDANDLIQWVKPRNAPGVFAESFRDTFDTMYSEGVRGAPRWADMVLHAHMAGRPTLIPSVLSCLAHAKAHDGIWWTTKSELAAWALEQDFRR